MTASAAFLWNCFDICKLCAIGIAGDVELNMADAAALARLNVEAERPGIDAELTGKLVENFPVGGNFVKAGLERLFQGRRRHSGLSSIHRLPRGW